MTLADPQSSTDEYAKAKLIGSLCDGYRLVLICNQLLEQTLQPFADDFQILINDEELEVKAVHLESPMQPNSSWSSITLLMNRVLPKATEIAVYYCPSKRPMWSIVDKKPLAAFDFVTQGADMKQAGGVVKIPEIVDMSSEVSLPVENVAIQTQALVKQVVGQCIQIVFSCELDICQQPEISHFRAEQDDKWLTISAAYLTKPSLDSWPELWVIVEEPLDVRKHVQVGYKGTRNNLRSADGRSVQPFTTSLLEVQASVKQAVEDCLQIVFDRELDIVRQPQREDFLFRQGDRSVAISSAYLTKPSIDSWPELWVILAQPLRAHEQCEIRFESLHRPMQTVEGHILKSFQLVSMLENVAARSTGQQRLQQFQGAAVTAPALLPPSQDAMPTLGRSDRGSRQIDEISAEQDFDVESFYSPEPPARVEDEPPRYEDDVVRSTPSSDDFLLAGLGFGEDNSPMTPHSTGQEWQGRGWDNAEDGEEFFIPAKVNEDNLYVSALEQSDRFDRQAGHTFEIDDQYIDDMFGAVSMVDAQPAQSRESRPVLDSLQDLDSDLAMLGGSQVQGSGPRSSMPESPAPDRPVSLPAIDSATDIEVPSFLGRPQQERQAPLPSHFQSSVSQTLQPQSTSTAAPSANRSYRVEQDIAEQIRENQRLARETSSRNTNTVSAPEAVQNGVAAVTADNLLTQSVEKTSVSQNNVAPNDDSPTAAWLEDETSSSSVLQMGPLPAVEKSVSAALETAQQPSSTDTSSATTDSVDAIVVADAPVRSQPELIPAARPSTRSRASGAGASKSLADRKRKPTIEASVSTSFWAGRSRQLIGLLGCIAIAGGAAYFYSNFMAREDVVQPVEEFVQPVAEVVQPIQAPPIQQQPARIPPKPAKKGDWVNPELTFEERKQAALDRIEAVNEARERRRLGLDSPSDDANSAPFAVIIKDQPAQQADWAQADDTQWPASPNERAVQAQDSAEVVELNENVEPSTSPELPVQPQTDVSSPEVPESALLPVITVDPARIAAREQCVVNYISGNRYKGSCFEGKKDGEGTFSWQSGDRYDGGWLNNKRHGKGVMLSADGTRTEGMWSNGVGQGEATIKWPSGTKYIGEVKSGLSHGRGTIFYTNGDSYKGDFRDGVKSGKGTLIMARGAKYEGQYSNNKKHGQGTYWSEKGSRFVGTFRDGYFTQEGTCYEQTGEKYAGPCR